MTELEKKNAGEVYDPTDPEICRLRTRGTGLARRLNDSGSQEERQALIKELFASVGENVRVNSPFHIDFGCSTTIGSNVVINLNCTFLDAAAITIGDRVLIGPDTKIYTTLHPMDPAGRFVPAGGYFQTLARPVTIGSDTWIGGNVTILPGVTIGSRCVIGAGSVVSRDIPDGSVAVGNPCRRLRGTGDT